MSDLLHEDVYGVYLRVLFWVCFYILTIKSVVQNAYCHLYADDTIILKGASDPNKAYLKKLYNKTVRYLDTPLRKKDKVKYLGVLFDEKMQVLLHLFY